MPDPSTPRLTTLALLPLLALAALAIAFTQPAENKAPGASPDLAFLAGHWRAEMGGGVIEEHWFPPVAGTTTGMLRWLAPDGAVRMLELITIKPGDDGPVMLLRHFDADMQPWEDEKDGPFTAELASHAPGSIAFRPTANARDAVRMTYESAGPDALRVTIDFRESSGRRPLVIDFTRVE